MIKLNTPYNCPYCPKVFVVLQGNGMFNSYLPVEVINGTEMNDRQFDLQKHRSHLLNCKELQAEWGSIKKRIDKQFK